MRFNGCDTEVSQCYLDHLAGDCPPQPGKRDVLTMDNASWHKVKSQRWHHFKPFYLPPYSPDLTPIERLWKYLKEEFLADFYTRDAEELENKIDESLRRLFRLPEKVTSGTANWQFKLRSSLAPLGTFSTLRQPAENLHARFPHGSRATTLEKPTILADPPALIPHAQ